MLRAVHRKTAELLFKKSLNSTQWINHFPNYTELTRKDKFAINWRKYMASTSESVQGVPNTYLLPEEYSLFKSQSDSSSDKLWIVKPGDKARGIGIFIIDSPNKLPKYLTDKYNECKETEQIPSWSKGSFVISEYISNPWLINSKKFDLRIYVLVTKFNPNLNAYIYRDGFARFCTENYTLNSNEINNTFVHLTNVAMNQLNVCFCCFILY